MGVRPKVTVVHWSVTRQREPPLVLLRFSSLRAKSEAEELILSGMEAGLAILAVGIGPLRKLYTVVQVD